MKIVVVEMKNGDGLKHLAVIVPDEDLFDFQVLCIKAGQQVLKITDEEQAYEHAQSLRS